MKHPTIWKIGHVVYEGGYALDKVYGSGTMAAPASIAWVCPECGNAWGHIKIAHSPQWISLMRKCEDHGDGRMIPYDLKELKEIPSKILRREILILNKHPLMVFGVS